MRALEPRLVMARCLLGAGALARAEGFARFDEALVAGHDLDCLPDFEAHVDGFLLLLAVVLLLGHSCSPF